MPRFMEGRCLLPTAWTSPSRRPPGCSEAEDDVTLRDRRSDLPTFRRVGLNGAPQSPSPEDRAMLRSEADADEEEQLELVPSSEAKERDLVELHMV